MEIMLGSKKVEKGAPKPKKELKRLEEGHVEGRTKCQPPIGLKLRVCKILDAVLADSDAPFKGPCVFVYDGISLKTGEHRISGIAARRSRKEPIVFFNLCPFCGENVQWWKRFKDRKAEDKRVRSKSGKVH